MLSLDFPRIYSAGGCCLVLEADNWLEQCDRILRRHSVHAMPYLVVLDVNGDVYTVYRCSDD